jgi:hypothetical protein
MAMALGGECIQNQRKTWTKRETPTPADRMGFTQRPERLFGVEVSSAHFLLIGKRREK